MYYVPPSWRDRRIPGQVPRPDDDTQQMMRLANAPPKRFHPDMLLAHTEPRTSISSIVRNLGLPSGEEQGWRKYLEGAMSGRNELEVRKALYERFQTEKTDPVLRRAIFQRAMVYYQGMRKSMMRIVTVDDLRKAEARGGKYYRRVPGDSGKGHRYIYDPDKYKTRQDAHLSGEDVAKERLHDKVLKCVEKSGEAGCHPKDFKSLVEKHGSDKVAEALRAHVQKGKVKLVQGHFYHKKHLPQDDTATPAPKPAPKFTLKGKP